MWIENFGAVTTASLIVGQSDCGKPVKEYGMDDDRITRVDIAWIHSQKFRGMYGHTSTDFLL